jgi:DNA-binding cell septation regulator SpoVG
VIDGWLVVHQIKLLHGPNGYFLEMPKRKRPGKHAIDLAFPSNDETRQMILNAIVAEYEKVAGQSLKQ